MGSPLARIGALVGVLLPMGAQAQFSMLEDPGTRFEWGGRIETDFRHQFETATDRGDEFDRWHVGLGGRFGGPINESILMGLDLRYAHESWDFNLDNALPSGFGGTALPREPWNTINVVDLVPNGTVLIGSRVAVAVGVPIRWAGESGSDRSGFAAGVSALVRWEVNEDVTLGAGIGVTSQLEDEAETFPLVALDWRINEWWQLRTEGAWIQGGKTILFWGPNETIRLRASAGWERTRFRLDDNGSAPDRNGVGEVTQVPIELGLRIQPRPGAYFDFHAGLAFAGRLRVEGDDGRKLYDQAFDPAPFLGFQITIPLGLPERAPLADPNAPPLDAETPPPARR